MTDPFLDGLVRERAKVMIQLRELQATVANLSKAGTKVPPDKSYLLKFYNRTIRYYSQEIQHYQKAVEHQRKLDARRKANG